MCEDIVLAPFMDSLCVRNKIMYELLWRTVYALLGCYFGVYSPRWCAARAINTKITLSWAHKQFATRVHALCSITYYCIGSWINYIRNRYNALAIGDCNTQWWSCANSWTTNGHCSLIKPRVPASTGDTKGYSSMFHYNDFILSMMASQITSLTIVYSTVYSGADQRKHHSSASLAFVRGIHR